MIMTERQSGTLAFSDLHDRLEHLITYSTQLIFVSGDGFGQQQDQLQAFLERQPDINVAFVKASAKLQMRDYRRHFITQLAGRVDLDFDRPLTELLSRVLGDDTEHLLISVSAGENLPKPMLKELWDLILQNRFARDRHHLNILIFARPDWVTQAKAWLPANSSDKPVLLMTESVVADEADMDALSSTDLDQMIAEKRRQFSERLKARAEAVEVEYDSAEKPVVQRWWVKLLVAIVFIVSFSGILLWQYFDLSRAALKDFGVFLFQSEMVETAATDLTEIPKEVVAAPAKPVTNPSSAGTESAKLQAKVTQPKPQSETEQAQLSDTAKSSDEILSEDGQQRVTDWQTAVKRMGPAVTVKDGSVQAATESHGEVTTASTTPLASSTIIDEAPKQNAAAESSSDSNTLVDDVVDYPVEDIAQPVNAMDEYDHVVLMNQAPEEFVLQLSGMSKVSVLEEYLQDNQLQGKVWIYHTQRYGGDWFVVLLNQSFSTLEAGRQRAVELPQALKTGVPFVKSLTQVQQEISLLSEKG